MRNFSSILRVIVIVVLAAFAAEYFLGTPEKPAIIAYPLIPVLLIFLAVVLSAIEIMIASVRGLTDTIMTPEQLAMRKEATKNVWYKRLYRKLLDQRPIDKEKDLEMDHEYDGIRELDNNLPPWWVYLFYATIIFACVYLLRYHIFGAANQTEEYEQSVAEAQAQIEEYKKNAPDLIDAESVTELTDAADLEAGKQIFQTNCVACHAADGGGGIGPNLTDDHWILGGGIKNVFHTISEGGREGKGMVAWKSVLKPKQIQEVASYVLSLQGTTPASPKEPQGDIIWKADGSSSDANTGETSSEEGTQEDSSASEA